VLILYCSVGDRSAKAARLLGESGHRNVYNMVDGFEGDATAGPAAGAALPGWQGAGLPVTFEMSEDQAYHSPTM
jgi:rhodanese-related sulfurtransferase